MEAEDRTLDGELKEIPFIPRIPSLPRFKKGRIRVAPLFVLIICAFPSLSNAEIRYEVIDLGNLGGNPTEAHAINDLSQVVGRADTSEGERHAFIWNATDGMTDLSELIGHSGEAVDINNRGEVIGSICSSDQVPRYAFSWTRETGMKLLHPQEFELSSAKKINNHGVTVGLVMNRSGDTQKHQTFLWENADSPGVIIAGPEDFFVPEAINDQGEISGWFRRARSRNGKNYSAMTRSATGDLRELEVPEDCESCGGVLIGELETLTGVCRDNRSYPVAIVRWKGAKIVDRMDFDSEYRSALMGAVGVNGLAFINVMQETIDPISRLIGWGLKPFRSNGFSSPIGPRSTADQFADFLFKKGVYKGVVYRKFPILWDGEALNDLNNLIPKDSGWELEEARDINNQGQIVGGGKHSGVYAAFLLNPLPPKASLP